MRASAAPSPRFQSSGQLRTMFAAASCRSCLRTSKMRLTTFQTYASVFFHNRRLYQIEGTVPAGGSTADGIRFQQSLDFTDGGGCLMPSGMSLGRDNNWPTTPPFIPGLGAPMRRIGVLMNGTVAEGNIAPKVERKIL